MHLEGRPSGTSGVTAWFGVISIVGGVLLILAGLARYRKTRMQLDTDTFEPAGLVIDIVSYILGLFGLALAGYLIYIELFRK